MAYVEPTVKDLKQRFPEFEIVPNELVLDYLEDAVSAVGSNWLDKDRARGQLLLAAHNLAIDGEPNRSQTIAQGGAANSAAVGGIIEMRDRDAVVKFSDKASIVSENSKRGDAGKSYELTTYGSRYYKLMRKNTNFFRAV